MVQSQEPAETRPRSKAQSAKLDTDETFSWLTQNIYFGATPQQRYHVPVNTVRKSHNHTFSRY